MLYKEQECVLTEQQMKEKIAYWQGILGLDYWEIKFAFKRQRDMNHKNQAEVKYALPKASAYIVMVCHEDYDNDVFPQDMETSLVHELLHIKCAAFDDLEEGTLQDAMMEQYIDNMAKILVTMDRERRGEYAYARA
jgi:phytoene dehydrogenase-like protein